MSTESSDVVDVRYYPSISSVSKNTWSVVDQLELLVYFNHPQFLLSCYDLYNIDDKAKINSLLDRARNQYQLILADSGIYEKIWKNDHSWSFEKYIEALGEHTFYQILNFDDYISNQNISSIEILRIVRSCIKESGQSNIFPIVHVVKEDFDELFIEICKDPNISFVAVPERELGQGIIEITKAIKNLSNLIRKHGLSTRMHILGTGNPISLMLYSFAGAHSFDGLDWCQTVVDYSTGTMHHYQHYDLYRHQSDDRVDSSLSYLTRCFIHNLLFYEEWTQSLRKAKLNSAIGDYLRQYILNDKLCDAFCEVLCN